jgi:hypothetical protein
LKPGCAGDREWPRRFATVWCAAGTPHAVFEIDTEAPIAAIPGGAVLDVA